MKPVPATPKIEFANSLRGIAVLLVLFGHYVYVFNAIKAKYSAFPAIDYYPFPWAPAVLNSYPLSYLNIGQVAVAFFFLVSGLVIPNAAANLGNTFVSRGAFVIGRVFRIWPTYICGLLISVSALWFNSCVNDAAFHQPIARILANVTLFRDWLGHAQIDGIVWTLEIKAKFYLFVLLFWSAIGKAKLYPIVIVCIIGLVAAPFGSTFDVTNGPQISIANFLWTFPYLIYMSMGIAFNYHMRGAISTKTLTSVLAITLFVFVYIAKRQGLYAQVPASYGSTLIVFVLMYFFARNWSGGPVIRFFAKISYPLYASHAALGYTGMAYMIGLGANPLMALAIQLALSTAIAWAIHVLVESPTHNIGKHLGRKLVTSKIPAEVATSNAV